MPTILSRFDTIFIVKDEHEQGKDMVRMQDILSGTEYLTCTIQHVNSVSIHHKSVKHR